MFLKLSDNPVSKKVSPSESLIRILEQINPDKLIFWKDSDIRLVVIDAKYVFWPLKIKADLLESVFSDFSHVLKEFCNRFESVEIITDSKTYESGANISFKSGYGALKGAAVVLTVFEAKILYDCLKRGEFKDECSCIIKIGNDEHFIANFPREITLSGLMSHIGSKFSRSMENLKPVDPVTGNTLQPELKLDGSLSSIFFMKTDARYDIPFPLWSMNTSESVKLKDVTCSENLQVPCCNCLTCVSVCPSGIAPNILYHLLLNDEVEEIDNYNITSCIRCGRCSVVCPSNIPLYSGITDFLQTRAKEEADEDS